MSPKYQPDTDTGLAAARCGPHTPCLAVLCWRRVSWEIVTITTVTTANVPSAQSPVAP